MIWTALEVKCLRKCHMRMSQAGASRQWSLSLTTWKWLEQGVMSAGEKSIRALDSLAEIFKFSKDTCRQRCGRVVAKRETCPGHHLCHDLVVICSDAGAEG